MENKEISQTDKMLIEIKPIRNNREISRKQFNEIAMKIQCINNQSNLEFHINNFIVRDGLEDYTKSSPQVRPLETMKVEEKSFPREMLVWDREDQFIVRSLANRIYGYKHAKEIEPLPEIQGAKIEIDLAMKLGLGIILQK